MKKLLILTIFICSAFATDKNIENPFENINDSSLISKKKVSILKKDEYKYSIKLFENIVEQSIAKTCEVGSECFNQGLDHLKDNIKSKIDLKAQAIDQLTSKNPKLGIKGKGTLKEGGWNFEGKVLEDIDVLCQSIISDYMDSDLEITLIEFTDMILNI